MAILTLALMRAHARLLARDDSTTPALLDARIDVLINQAYQTWRAAMAADMMEEETILGMDVAINDPWCDTSDTQDITEFVEILYDTIDGSFNFSNHIERVSRGDIEQLYQGDNTTTGPPQYIALIRLGTSSLAATTDQIGKWIGIVWPKPNTSYFFAGIVRKEPNVLGVAELSDADSYAVARLAAAYMASVLGRPRELVRDIIEGLPLALQASLDLEALIYRPAVPFGSLVDEAA